MAKLKVEHPQVRLELRVVLSCVIAWEHFHHNVVNLCHHLKGHYLHLDVLDHIDP